MRIKRHFLQNRCHDGTLFSRCKRAADLVEVTGSIYEQGNKWSKISSQCFNVSTLVLDQTYSSCLPIAVAPIGGGGGGGGRRPPKIPPIFFLLVSLIQCSIYVHAYQAFVDFST